MPTAIRSGRKSRSGRSACCKTYARLFKVAGGGLADIARLAIFITEREHIEPVMAVRRRVLTLPYPTTTVVIVAGLVNPEWLVEIEATAVLP